MSLASEIIQELTDKSGMDFTGGVYLSDSTADGIIQEYADRDIIGVLVNTAGNILIGFIEYTINYNDQEYDYPLPVTAIKDGNDYKIKILDTVNSLADVYKTADTLLAFLPGQLVGVLVGADLGITLNDLAYEWYDEDQMFWYWDKERYKEISMDDLVTLFYNVTTNSWYVPKDVYNEVIDSFWARGIVQHNAEQPMAKGIRHYTNSYSGLDTINGSIEPRQLTHNSNEIRSWTKSARGNVAFKINNTIYFGAPTINNLYLSNSVTYNNDEFVCRWQGSSALPRDTYRGSVTLTASSQLLNGRNVVSSSGSLTITGDSSGTTYSYSLGSSGNYQSYNYGTTTYNGHSVYYISSSTGINTSEFTDDANNIIRLALTIANGGDASNYINTSGVLSNLTSMDFGRKISDLRKQGISNLVGSCNVANAIISATPVPTAGKIVWDWFHSIFDSEEESTVESSGIVPSIDTPDYPPYSDDDIVPIPNPPINPYIPEPTTDTITIPDDPTIPIPSIVNKWRDIDPTPPPEPGGDPVIVTPGSGSVPVPPANEPNEDLGFCAIWRMTPSYLESFCQWLWSTNFIDQVLAYFTSPNDAIVGVHKIYWTPTYSSVLKEIQCGYLNSNCNGWPVTQRYNTIDCGSVTLNEEYGNVYDYADTEVIIYLPYIGFIPLDLSLCMRGSIGVKYVLDVVSGAGVCQISVTRDGLENHIASYGCSCASPIPISSGNYIAIVQSVATAAAQAIQGVGGLVNSKAFAKMNDLGKAGQITGVAEGALGALDGAKTNVQLSGRFSSQVGDMDNKKPYIIIKRPNAVPAQRNYDFIGKPSRQVATLSELSGFNQVVKIHPADTGAMTEEEIAEMEEIFSSGVIM
ncbi:MAG: hypothetical protein IKS59_06145 [Aeriscardovia sp.]|nr:hypothetical protein [Aeriscardovia sp.]